MANRKTETIKNVTLGTLKQVFGKGRFASVEFVKNDGSLRILNGKTLVKRGLKGGEAAYDAESNGQIRVFDVNVKDKDGKRVGGYRTVTAKKVLSVRTNGIIYKLEGGVESITAKPTEFINDVKKVNGGIVVKMNGKDEYKYDGVSDKLAQRFQDSEEKGKFFNANIKNQFTFVKL